MDYTNELLQDVSILTIDDDLTLQQSILKMFEGTGVNFIGAPNAEVGIQVAKLKQPQLILLDWNMPNMSGFEALEILKNTEETADIPIIMMTAVSTTSQNAYKALSSGADDFLRKPFDQPELLGRICSVRRVYESKNIIKSQNESLLKLADEKSRLLSIISHDLKSPLNNIEGLIHLVGMEIRQHNITSEIPTYLGMMEKMIKSEKEIISQTLEMHEINTKQLHDQLEKVELISFIQDQLSTFTYNSKNIELKFSSEVRDLAIDSIPNFLKKVIDNLISNAIKYSHENTLVNVSLRDSQKYVQLTIQDQGQGFHAEEIGQVFQKFGKFSAKPTGGESATGIGLYIIKNIMDRLGGTIQLKSEWGKGSTFTVLIPKKKRDITDSLLMKKA